jgi:hypothetical protein
MTEVISIIGNSKVNRHLDSAKSGYPSDHCLRQSHLIAAFNAIANGQYIKSQFSKSFESEFQM